MRTSRDHRDSQQLDLYPRMQECPACHQPLTERYHKQRWIVRLDQHVKVVSHFLECGNTDCDQRAVVYRPDQEDALALRGYTFGLDVVARIGELRYRDNLSITQDSRAAPERIESLDLHQRGRLTVRGLSGVGHHGRPSRCSAHRAVANVGVASSSPLMGCNRRKAMKRSTFCEMCVRDVC